MHRMMTAYNLTNNLCATLARLLIKPCMGQLVILGCIIIWIKKCCDHYYSMYTSCMKLSHLIIVKQNIIPITASHVQSQKQCLLESYKLWPKYWHQSITSISSRRGRASHHSKAKEKLENTQLSMFKKQNISHRDGTTLPVVTPIILCWANDKIIYLRKFIRQNCTSSAQNH